MRMKCNRYVPTFENGGVEIRGNGEILYYNRRPMYAFIKNGAVNN